MHVGQVVVADRLEQEPLGLFLSDDKSAADFPGQTSVVVCQAVTDSPDADRILIGAQCAAFLRADGVQAVDGNVDRKLRAHDRIPCDVVRAEGFEPSPPESESGTL